MTNTIANILKSAPFPHLPSSLEAKNKDVADDHYSHKYVESSGGGETLIFAEKSLLKLGSYRDPAVKLIKKARGAYHSYSYHSHHSRHIYLSYVHIHSYHSYHEHH